METIISTHLNHFLQGFITVKLITPIHHDCALNMPRGSRNDVTIQQVRMRVKVLILICNVTVTPE